MPNLDFLHPIHSFSIFIVLVLSLREEKPVNDKETNGVPISWPVWNTDSLMAVTFYIHVLEIGKAFMLKYCDNPSCILVCVGAAPIMHQFICNRRDDVDRSSSSKGAFSTNHQSYRFWKTNSFHCISVPLSSHASVRVKFCTIVVKNDAFLYF